MAFFIDPPKTLVETENSGKFFFIMNKFVSLSHFYLFKTGCSESFNGYSPEVHCCCFCCVFNLTSFKGNILGWH